MIYIIDGKIDPGKAVRSLLYTDDADLSGDTLETVNGNVVDCEVGSIAMKPGFADMKQLAPNGNWVDC